MTKIRTDKKDGHKYPIEKSGSKNDKGSPTKKSIKDEKDEDADMAFAKEKSEHQQDMERIEQESHDTEPEGLLREKMKLPEYQSEEWNEIKRDVENRIAHDFNDVPLENLERINEYWFEDVVHVEVSDNDIKDYLGVKSLDGVDEGQIDDAKESLDMEQSEIMWGTLFEAKDTMLAEKILANDEKIINGLGFTIIDMSRSDKVDAYQTGVFLGINGAGYDFYEQHWVPLYRLFGWV